MNSFSIKVILLFILLVSLLTGCGDPTSTPNPTPTPKPINFPSFKCLSSITTSDDVVQSCVDNSSPTQDSDVIVYGRLIINGKPIPEAKMETKWNFKYFPSSYNSVTDKDGIANITKNIGNATINYRVVIDIKFTWKDKSYSSETSFLTIEAPTPTPKPTPTPTFAPPTATPYTNVLTANALITLVEPTIPPTPSITQDTQVILAKTMLEKYNWKLSGYDPNVLNLTIIGTYKDAKLKLLVKNGKADSGEVSFSLISEKAYTDSIGGACGILFAAILDAPGEDISKLFSEATITGTATKVYGSHLVIITTDIPNKNASFNIY